MDELNFGRGFCGVPPRKINQNAQTDLSWDAVDNASEYRIYRATSSGSNTAGYSRIATVSDPTTSYSDTGVTDSETYYYCVTAYNPEDGESAVSNESSATTPVPAPTDLSVTVSGDQFDLTWTDNALNEDGYRVRLGRWWVDVDPRR
nr:hypothetical protein [Haloferax larsenii]